jgi:hypothetical protein
MFIKGTHFGARPAFSTAFSVTWIKLQKVNTNMQPPMGLVIIESVPSGRVYVV